MRRLLSAGDRPSVRSGASVRGARSGGAMLQFLASADGALESRSYVDGFTASALDVALLRLVGGAPDAGRYPHLARWYRHVQSLQRLGETFPPPASARSLQQCGIVVPSGAAAPQPGLADAAAASQSSPAESAAAPQPSQADAAAAPQVGARAAPRTLCCGESDDQQRRQNV